VLLYAGRLSREKGLSALVSLERRLADLGVAHRLVLVGDGPMRDELTRALPEAVFMGTLDREDIAVAMASSDVFVFPSCTDTAGNVVLEAQASGLPVVVMDAGGPSENMDHGRTGFVCEDAARFEIAVISLLHSAVSRQVLSTGARAYAERRRWRSALAPLFRAYEELHHRREAVVAGAEAAAVR
jgi:glycosyltransferase involved in cell wall biosynthesis